jgi:signal transduction histidine kinase
MALDAGGLGVGLAVVRDLVEAHGGTVVATSAGKNLGSQFVVTLPMKAKNGQVLHS